MAALLQSLMHATWGYEDHAAGAAAAQDNGWRASCGPRNEDNEIRFKQWEARLPIQSCTGDGRTDGLSCSAQLHSCRPLIRHYDMAAAILPLPLWGHLFIRP